MQSKMDRAMRPVEHTANESLSGRSKARDMR